jgi:hypothetical protein
LEDRKGRNQKQGPLRQVRRTALLPLPERGVPGGWRDPWEDDPVAEARAVASQIDRRIRTVRPLSESRARRRPALLD